MFRRTWSVTVFASLRRKRIGTTMPPLKPPEQDWRDLARQASIEEDPEKLLNLLQQVIETYDEAKRRGRRQSTTARL
jgi:hypothetical protein